MPAEKIFLIIVGVLLGADLVFLNWKVLMQKPQEKIVETVKLTEAEPTPEPIEAKAVPVEVEIASPIPRQAAAVTREVFIPLGSGTTISEAWSNTGAQGYIDTRLYSIKEAYFQASLKSNSGKIFARMWQNNEGAMVPGSEIKADGGTSNFVTSDKLLLSEGNKLYIVQVKSEAGQEASVENAKVRLIVQ